MVHLGRVKNAVKSYEALAGAECAIAHMAVPMQITLSNDIPPPPARTAGPLPNRYGVSGTILSA